MSTPSNESSRAYAATGTSPRPWGWLVVLGAVILMTMAGAGWLYQKNSEWPSAATDDPQKVASEHALAPDSTPDPASVPLVAGASRPADIFPSPTLAAPPEPAIAGPAAAPELPTDAGPTPAASPAESTARESGADSARNAEALSSATVYTIQPGDTLGAIAARLYGKRSQWKVIAQANPELDPRRLRVGQEIKVPPVPREPK